MINQLPQIQTGRHYLTWIVCSFAAGIFYGLNSRIIQNISFAGLALYSSLFLCACLLILLLIHSVQNKFLIPFSDLILTWFVVFCFILGIFRVIIYDDFQYKSLKSTAGSEINYIGVIMDEPSESSTGKTLGFPVRIIGYEADNKIASANGSIMLYAKPALCRGLSLEDVISFSAILKEPINAAFDGGFSNRSYLYRQGLAYSSITDKPIEKFDAAKPSGITYHLNILGHKLNYSILSSIDRAFGAENEESALIKGILLGSRDDFTDEQYSRFAKSGFIHITAVSGMHVMFLFGFLTFLFRKLRCPKWLINLLIAPVLILFAAAAAFTPSVSRAVIMVTMIILASLLRRESDPLTSLSFAAAVLLIINPYTLTSYSFVLSFSATAGIILLASPMFKICTGLITSFTGGGSDTSRRSSLYKITTEIFLQSAGLSVSAQLGLMFFIARYFNTLNYGSIIGNALIIPLASVSFIGGLLIWLLHFILPAAAAFIAQYPLRLVLWIINRLVVFFSLPIFSLYIPTPPKSFFVIYILIFYVIFYYLNNNRYSNRQNDQDS